MFSILVIELTIQRNSKMSLQIMCFGQRSQKNTQQQQNETNQPIKKPGIQPGPLAPQSGVLDLPLYHPPRQKVLKVSIHLTVST